ncbi:hypothetical protein ACM66B_005071 [Microbotryomycetes sp. NB124-2]
MPANTSNRARASLTTSKQARPSRSSRATARHDAILSTDPEQDVTSGDAHGRDQQNDDKEPDADSQAEWLRLVAAFTGKKTKEREQAIKIANQCEKLLADTARNTEREATAALTDTDGRIKQLDLSGSSVPHATVVEELVKLSDTQIGETEAQLADFDELLENIMPDRNPFFAEVREAIEQRPLLARKVQKRIRKMLEHELQLNAELAQKHAQADNSRVKHFKAILHI